MKKLMVLAVASLFATSAVAGEMKWTGSTGARYTMLKQDDSLNTKNASGKDVSITKSRMWDIRANLGATGGWENVEWGVGARTTNSAVTDYATFNKNADVGFGIEQAWFRYLREFGSVDFNVTVGRQKTVFANDMHSENFWDNDVRWDGFGWQFNFGMFGLNMAQYIAGAVDNGAATAASSYSYTDGSSAVPTTQSKFSVLYGFQPHMTWKFSDEIETFFAVGFFKHSGFQGYTNTAPNYSTNTGNSTGVVNMDNSRMWQFYNTWTLPYNLTFIGEYVINKEQRYGTVGGAGANAFLNAAADKSALALSLVYGKINKAHDWTLAYTYGSKGLGSVYNTTTKGQWQADNKGHLIKAAYALADNFNVGVNAFFLKEKAHKGSTGQAFTTNANEDNKETRYEVVAGVSF